MHHSATSLEITSASKRAPPSGSSHTTELVRTESLPVILFNERAQELSSEIRRVSSGALPVYEEYVYETGFHKLLADEVVRFLGTSSSYGLSATAVKRRQQKDGLNRIAAPVVRPFWVKFSLALFSGFCPLLFFASCFEFAVSSFIANTSVPTAGILTAIVLLGTFFISGTFTFYQEWLAVGSTQGFADFIPKECLVLRDGLRQKVEVESLVIGDIVTVGVGQRVPADLRVISEVGALLDRSMLTGENEPMRLFADPVSGNTTILGSYNIALVGCTLTEGEFVGVVIGTGKDCQLSKISTLVTDVSMVQTGLQRDITHFVGVIAIFVFVFSLTCILDWALFLRPFHPKFMSFDEFLGSVNSVFVAFVPEGLSISLSIGLLKFAQRLRTSEFGVTVSRLSIIESMGAMTLLASDKTGTLTTNQMRVSQVITAEEAYPARNAMDVSNLPLDVLFQLQGAAFFCTQASLKRMTSLDSSNTTPLCSGHSSFITSTSSEEDDIVGDNGIDRAMLHWLVMPPASDATIAQLITNLKLRAMLPFSSVTKMSACVLSYTNGAFPSASSSSSHVVVVKGAPEYILERCSSFLQQPRSGEDQGAPLASFIKENIYTKIAESAALGERVICVARRFLDSAEYGPAYPFRVAPDCNFPLEDLEFVACVSVSDPPRKAILESVLELKRAGIKVAMLTGDASNTALAIAQMVGIVQSAGVSRLSSIVNTSDTDSQGNFPSSHTDALLVHGTDVDNATEETWDCICAHRELIFSRLTPDHKLVIVKEMQRRGEIVGVTGDGVNDSPALKRADCGIAMASGSDIARHAASVVLRNDDFRGIVKGVEAGRLLFENLRKIIAYQISMGCWGEVIPILATFYIGMDQPLSSFLMIILSCITDVYAGVALTTEPAEDDIMLRPPRNTKTQRLVNFELISYGYFFYGSLESLACLFIYFLYMAQRGPLDDASSTRGYSASQLIQAWDSDLLHGDDDKSRALIEASSVYFICAISCQWGHLCSVRKKRPYLYEAIMDPKHEGGALSKRIYSSIFPHGFIKRDVIFAILLSLLTGLFLTEVPAIQTTCRTTSVGAKWWGISLGLSTLIFVLGEVRKWILVLYFPLKM